MTFRMESKTRKLVAKALTTRVWMIIGPCSEKSAKTNDIRASGSVFALLVLMGAGGLRKCPSLRLGTEIYMNMVAIDIFQVHLRDRHAGDRIDGMRDLKGIEATCELLKPGGPKGEVFDLGLD